MMPDRHTDGFDLIPLQDTVLVRHGPSGRRFYCYPAQTWRVTEVFTDGSAVFIREQDSDEIARSALAYARHTLKP